MLADDLFEIENIYPVYNWKIFHTRPDKVWTRHFVYIKKMDDKVFDPPVELYDLKDQLPHVNTYTLANKIHFMGELFGGPETQKYVDAINENLIRDHKIVEWDFAEVTFDALKFQMRHEYIDKKILGQYSVKNPGAAP